MSGLPSPSFGRGSPRMMIPTGRGHGGSPWSETSYNGEASSQPDSPLSPLFRSSPRGQADSPDFIPLGNSSPNPRFRGGRARAKWTNFHYSQQRISGCGNMSFNNNSGNFHGDNSGFSPGLSPYSQSRSNSFSPRRRRRGGSGGPGSHSPMADVSLYYQHSMVEDPWAPLEHRLALNASRAALNATRSSQLI
ncbi:hypothetical protein B566_EDAN011828 [Ephemera danica]|nr:hypothetical protein B566_EDAN011828 [Ephemera danica]